MTYAFAAIEHCNPSPVVLAVFWDVSAAIRFAKAENEAVQADLVEVEAIALVDNYGFPCTISDLPIIAPWAA